MVRPPQARLSLAAVPADPRPAYRYPRGYSYRRWRVGLLLPAIFFSNAYYYNNYTVFGFGSPPRGYRGFVIARTGCSSMCELAGSPM